ncbi:microsomal glutathione S-transferase 1 [Tribolium castaneum]|uniref:microsomal glutathione S-transferase 1 n=1 Tax=Tribolium castaneum TaxID=7070 RepID=UPI0000D5686D|nr:PREDICTED: microsomal glutathione S-transferase 1 [Tribolium castaneum]|eukprot:XP_968617.1 PREDICTED: microsomal glutathione S-transferase 1 [Tribolium castaneum]
MAQVTDFSTLLESPVFRAYLFYSAILVVKMMIMSPMTGMMRFRYKAFANPEDGASLKVKPRTDDNVERVRRAHLNDLENISLFFVIGFIYVLTNPAVAWATLLFRIYTAARFMHTLVYAIFVVPQPARALAWVTGFVITGYMALTSIVHFL